MGKIKISIHNLYKNIINYNIIGGASITASVSNDNSSAILKKILLLLIRKKELNIQITNLINNYQKEIKDINDELKKRDSYKRDLERDLDDLPKELSNYIEEYKQTFYELESIKQTNFNIKDITLLEYKNIKVNEEYLNIISLISKYWSKTSFDENDIKEILNIDKDIQKHMKKEILKKIQEKKKGNVSTLTNDEVLDILKTIIELTRKSEKDYFKKQIIETIDYFISFVQDAKTKDSQNILKYYEDLKDLSIIKLPEETSYMFGIIKFELNENLELVGNYTNVEDPKKLEKYKKKLEAFKGIDDSRYFKIPLDKFVKQQMKNREDYAKLNNFWYLIDQKGKENKFKFLGIDQGNISLLNEIVNTYNINFTYKGNGKEFNKEDHLKTWEKILNKVKKAIEEADKRKPKEEADKRKPKEAEETDLSAVKEKEKSADKKLNTKKVADIGFEIESISGSESWGRIRYNLSVTRWGLDTGRTAKKNNENIIWRVKKNSKKVDISQTVDIGDEIESIDGSKSWGKIRYDYGDVWGLSTNRIARKENENKKWKVKKSYKLDQEKFNLHKAKLELEKEAKEEQKAQAAKKAKEEAEARKKRFELEKKKLN